MKAVPCFFFFVFSPPTSLAAKQKLKAMIKQRKEDKSPALFPFGDRRKKSRLCLFEKLPAVF